MSKPIEFDASTTSGGAFSEPTGAEKVGGVVVVQEWHGINDEMRSKVDRFGHEGFLTVAPDLYHGRVTTSDAEAAKWMAALDFPRAVGEILGAVRWLKERPRSNGKVAVVGFCLGGALTFAAAAAAGPDIACAVPFYGLPDPSKIDLGGVAAPILAHFGSNDDFASPDKARRLRQDFEARGKSMELHVYEGAGHAFMRQTDPTKYHPASANEAWTRTLAFLHRHLG